MTIQEAIATKLPFKRPDWQTWVHPAANVIFHKTRDTTKHVTKEDLAATDWEVERPYAQAVEEIKAILEKHGITRSRFSLRRSSRDSRIIFFGGAGRTNDVPTTKHDLDPKRRAQRSSPICHCGNCRRRRARAE